MDIPAQWTTDSLRSIGSRTTGGNGYDVLATDGPGPDAGPGDRASLEREKAELRSPTTTDSRCGEAA